MRWFGHPYRAPIYHDIERTETPLGEQCSHCGEPFIEGDDGFEMPMIGRAGVERVFLHRECHLRSVFGSVAHIQRRCSCYVPGAEEGDPEGMTKREAARAAVAEYEKYDFPTLERPR